MERSCTTLKLFRSYPPWEGEAELLVKLSGRLPGLKTLHTTTIQAVQALSLDTPPIGEQLHACAWDISASSPSQPHNHDVTPPLCCQVRPMTLHPALPISRCWRIFECSSKSRCARNMALALPMPLFPSLLLLLSA